MMSYANLVYDILASKCEYMDAIYEVYILELVGSSGLDALLAAGYLEGCGVINGRQLYVLTEKRDGGV